METEIETRTKNEENSNKLETKNSCKNMSIAEIIFIPQMQTAENSTDEREPDLWTTESV